MNARALLRAIVAVVGASALIGTLFVVGAQRSEALSGSEFNPGNIITDDVFFNYQSMSAAQIQAFLVSMESGCTGGNGYPCLKDYRENTWSRPDAGANRCTAYNGANGELASTIIWRVSVACQINPQVLIATLQKEQGLVTSTAPTARQYTAAMGYGCPDTAPCDSQFYGFYNQVYKAAWQFRTYTRSPDQWNFRPGVVNVAFNPNAGCGASAVNIQNQATANLYNYTPYQPNAAALANLSGTGNSCSSYGNRNFWVYFNTWFGSSVSQGPLLIAQKYAAYGGTGGALGAVTSPILSITQNSGGLGQAFVNGSIYWNINAGAHVVLAGPLRDFYFAAGGAAGSYGWPLSDTQSLAQNGGGWQQAFTAGAVYSSAAGTYMVSGSIRTAYFARNGAVGDFGWPTSAANCGLPNGGCVQNFQGGAIYTNPGGTAFSVPAGFNQLYTAAGGPAGSWGYPNSNPLVVASASGNGTGQVFIGGSLYARNGSAPNFVSGPIRDFYFSKSGATGSLGWPAGAATCTPDGASCTQTFTGGTVAWTKAGGAKLTAPEIDAAYAALGGASGALGAVRSDPIWIPQNGGGLGKVYAGGSIYWSTATGAYAVSGRIRDTYFTVTGAAGPLGWPTSAADCGFSGAGCSQSFQSNSLIAGRASTGYYMVTGAYTPALIAAGGTAGVLGLPTSTVLNISSNGGGTGQAFDGGSIYSSRAGTFAVTGGMRDFYFSRGGAAGALGWPAAAMACSAGACTQKFTGGTVSWTSAGGGAIVP